MPADTYDEATGCIFNHIHVWVKLMRFYTNEDRCRETGINPRDLQKSVQWIGGHLVTIC